MISVTENNTISCMCNTKAVIMLLQTCKKFSAYLPLKYGACERCYNKSFGGRNCDVCYICKNCSLGLSPQGMSCHNCRKLGVLKCEKCTCSHCGNSSNVTGLTPDYRAGNLKLCSKCAKRKYGDDYYREHKEYQFNSDHFGWADTPDFSSLYPSFHFILPMFRYELQLPAIRYELPMIRYKLKLDSIDKSNFKLINSYMINIQNKKYKMYQKQNANKLIEKLTIKPINQTPYVAHKNYKQNLRQTKNFNHNVRRTGQIQQRNARK